MAHRFNQVIKHGHLAFSPGFVYEFEDAIAGDYFVAAGWADVTSDPVDYTISAGSVTVDPETVFADGPNRGRKVLEG